MAEKTMTRKRPISLLTTGDCSDNSSEDSDPHSDSDSNSSCSVTDDKRRYCFLKRAARQMVMVSLYGYCGSCITVTMVAND